MCGMVHIRIEASVDQVLYCLRHKHEVSQAHRGGALNEENLVKMEPLKPQNSSHSQLPL